MPFQKGQSGNPKGRPPRGQAFAEILRAQLEELHAGKTKREHIAARVVAQAMAGDLDAVKWIVDRTDGRAPERIEATVEAEHRHSLPDATLDAVLGYYAAKRGAGDGAP